MNEGAAVLLDNVVPCVPVRQWVLSVPMRVRFWRARNPRLIDGVFVEGQDSAPEFIETLKPIQTIQKRMLKPFPKARLCGRELERLCRYILRPPVAEERIKLKGASVVYKLKSRWSDGTSAIVLLGSGHYSLF